VETRLERSAKDKHSGLLPVNYDRKKFNRIGPPRVISVSEAEVSVEPVHVGRSGVNVIKLFCL
jgi:hypothetical protein